ncbi:MAG: hypothetical protein ACYCWN_08190 [Ferrimicrobium sp.]|uniref:Uncharacterized protein n=1 Tax=Ferrimicrobium acidiphilum TaxID=121039 RepID=A0ABV3XZR0_9ACTN|nr:hypothetical protein [Ferrimicrobium sp.]
MKARKIVRGGTVIALGLGLASVGTGMGLTASSRLFKPYLLCDLV